MIYVFTSIEYLARFLVPSMISVFCKHVLFKSTWRALGYGQATCEVMIMYFIDISEVTVIKSS